MGRRDDALADALAGDLEPGESIVASAAGVQLLGGLTRFAMTGGMSSGRDAADMLEHGAVLVVTDRRFLVVAAKYGGNRPDRLAAAAPLTDVQAELGSKRMMMIKVPTLTVTYQGADPVTFEASKARTRDMESVAAAMTR